MYKPKPCPFCGGEKFVSLEAMGGEWVGLIIRRHGDANTRVCLGCGIVSIPSDQLERIRRDEDGRANILP